MAAAPQFFYSQRYVLNVESAVGFWQLAVDCRTTCNALVIGMNSMSPNGRLSPVRSTIVSFRLAASYTLAPLRGPLPLKGTQDVM